MAQEKGDGVRLGVGRLEWALHPRPARALTRCPVAASTARGPSGRLADPGLLGPCGGIHPSPDRGGGFFGLGNKQPKAAHQTDPALTDQSPGWTLPLPPGGVSGSLELSRAPLPAQHPAGKVQLVLHAGLVQDRKPVGLGGARVLPRLSPPYPGLGVLPLGRCLPPSWSPGETRRLKPGPPHTLSPHQPACPRCSFFSTIKPPRSGGLQNPGGETKVGVSPAARPAGHLVTQPAGHLVTRPSDQMARDDPGSAAGRQAGRPLTEAGVRSLWEAPPRGSLPPRPLLRPGDFPLRPSGRPADLRGIVGRPPTLHLAVQGGRPPCWAARGGGGLPRARARRPSPPDRRQRDAGGRPRTETKAWLRR
ncbi:hypothetical protein NDU88_001854 [Pleurodeles waltl]|uniref:Uncharacterized protein n=1 Tax=Pleurodeles waltl TaxID=8319 RepID=A0AAV7RAA6_PLEWA|nr:hypothetical protein NDU88_001854 [Pleurodeles waltl]